MQKIFSGNSNIDLAVLNDKAGKIDEILSGFGSVQFPRHY